MNPGATAVVAPQVVPPPRQTSTALAKIETAFSADGVESTAAAEATARL